MTDTTSAPTTHPSPVVFPEGMTPGFYLTARALTHLGDYRRFYAPLALWLLIMAIVPRTQLPSSFAEETYADAPTTQVAPAAPLESAIGTGLTEPSFGAVVPIDTFSGEFLAPLASPTGSDAAADDDGDAGFDDEPGLEAEPPPADAGSDVPFSIPPPPALPLPPVPAELEPILRVVSPLANQACSPIGLAGVVIALAGPAVDPVPAAQLAPYLTPLYVACAQFPQVGPRTVCEVDRVYGQDATGGLLPPPAVIGLGIDTIEQMERLGSGFAPGQAATLRSQLNCTRG